MTDKNDTSYFKAFTNILLSIEEIEVYRTFSDLNLVMGEIGINVDKLNDTEIQILSEIMILLPAGVSVDLYGKDKQITKIYKMVADRKK